MPTWPATLPQCPIISGFSEQKQTNNAGFSPDVGPPKGRRRSTATCVSTTVPFKMTNQQKLDFEDFFGIDLADGTLPFTWLHPVTKVSYSWMFTQGSAPKMSRLTTRTWMISCELLRLP